MLGERHSGIWEAYVGGGEKEGMCGTLVVVRRRRRAGYSLPRASLFLFPAGDP